MFKLQIFKTEDYQAGKTHPGCLICFPFLSLRAVRKAHRVAQSSPRQKGGEDAGSRPPGSNPGFFTIAESPGQVISPGHTSVFLSVHRGNNGINSISLLWGVSGNSDYKRQGQCRGEPKKRWSLSDITWTLGQAIPLRSGGLHQHIGMAWVSRIEFFIQRFKQTNKQNTEGQAYSVVLLNKNTKEKNI